MLAIGLVLNTRHRSVLLGDHSRCRGVPAVLSPHYRDDGGSQRRRPPFAPCRGLLPAVMTLVARSPLLLLGPRPCASRSQQHRCSAAVAWLSWSIAVSNIGRASGLATKSSPASVRVSLAATAMTRLTVWRAAPVEPGVVVEKPSSQFYGSRPQGSQLTASIRIASFRVDRRGNGMIELEQISSCSRIHRSICDICLAPQRGERSYLDPFLGDDTPLPSRLFLFPLNRGHALCSSNRDSHRLPEDRGSARGRTWPRLADL